MEHTVDAAGLVTFYGCDDAGQGHTVTTGTDAPTVGMCWPNFTDTDPGPNPPVASYGYNTDDQLISETLPGGTRTWNYDQGSGRLGSMTQDLPGSVRTTTLGYKPSGDVGSETTGTAIVAYDYDLAGQLTTYTSQGSPTVYTYDRGRLMSAKVANAPATVYAYDERSRLTSSTSPSGAVTTYGFDGAGRRVSETTGTNTTTYSYNPAGKLTTTARPTSVETRTLDPDGFPARVAVTGTSPSDTRLDWDINQPVAQMTTWTTSAGTTGLIAGPSTWAGTRRGTTITAVGCDTAGSATNTTGQTNVQATSYTPWGVANLPAPSRPTLGNRSELALNGTVYLRNRDYQPTTTGFTTTDPLGDIAATPVNGNPYHYTNNNPRNLVDPLGLRPHDPRAGFGDSAFSNKRVESNWSGLVPGLIAGIGDYLDSINPLKMISGLFGAAKQVAKGCSLFPWPDLGCMARNVKNMVVDSVTSIIDEIKTAMNSGDGIRTVLAVLSPIFGIDVDSCVDEGWQYCIARAVAPSLIGAVVTAGVGLVAKATDLVERLRGAINKIPGHIADKTELARSDQRGSVQIGKATEAELPGTVRHYTTSEFAESISKGGEITPGPGSGKTWLTPDEYLDGVTAQSKLALNKTPDGYFEIPMCRVECPSSPSVVQPYNGQPGGGIEITTNSPIDVTGIPFIQFGAR